MAVRESNVLSLGRILLIKCFVLFTPDESKRFGMERAICYAVKVLEIVSKNRWRSFV